MKLNDAYDLINGNKIPEDIKIIKGEAIKNFLINIHL